MAPWHHVGATMEITLDKNGSLYDPAGTESWNMQIRYETMQVRLHGSRGGVFGGHRPRCVVLMFSLSFFFCVPLFASWLGNVHFIFIVISPSLSFHLPRRGGACVCV